MKLTTCRELLKRITALEARLKILEATTLTARKFDGLPHGISAESIPERLTRQLIDGRRELEHLRVEFATSTTELATEIYRRVVDVNQSQVLLMRYVACKTFDEIAAQMNFSKAHIFRLHRIGRNHFADADEKGGRFNLYPWR